MILKTAARNPCVLQAYIPPELWKVQYAQQFHCSFRCLDKLGWATPPPSTRQAGHERGIARKAVPLRHNKATLCCRAVCRQQFLTKASWSTHATTQQPSLEKTPKDYGPTTSISWAREVFRKYSGKMPRGRSFNCCWVRRIRNNYAKDNIPLLVSTTVQHIVF